MKKKTIDIRVAPGWVEFESRAWRKDPSPAGILRMSVNPPAWEEMPPKEMMEGILMKQLFAMKMPLGELQSSACDDFTIGPAAMCLYRVPDVGLVMFCMIAFEASLFFTFEQVGKNDDEYEEQMIEALGILQRSAIT
jgi:hypothetical protein